jgi:L-threonylcarbamoyladenylate synthase
MQTRTIRINPKRPEPAKIRKAAEVIRLGRLVAFPTETVYGLGANALDPRAVRKIFEAKGRPADNPLIVHIYDKNDILFLASDISSAAGKITQEFWPGPLTVVLKKSKIVPKITTGGMDTVAIRMPKNKIARLLIKEAGVPIAAPSANFAGRPSPTTAKHVLEDLKGRIGMIVDGGKTQIGIESTVIDLSRKTPILLRPGGVTLEQLRKVLGRVDVHPVVMGKSSSSLHRSPGMKYRHYSPKAKIILIEGARNKADSKIGELVSSFKKKGKKVGIMTMGRSSPHSADMKRYVGSHHGEIAANLFRAFREFDSKGIDTVLAHGISSKGLGLGIMNRLRKAAYKKIKV